MKNKLKLLKGISDLKLWINFLLVDVLGYLLLDWFMPSLLYIVIVMILPMGLIFLLLN